MNPTIQLRGMTWNHPRGFAPMAATAQRFQELHPHLRITWDQRSLKAFEDFPVEQLAEQYDLIVLDHPCVPAVSRLGVILPLDQHLPAAFLADQAENSAGGSHATYLFDGHLWALAIDAATPVAFWREDLLEHYAAQPPRDWDELLALAARGLVEVPAAPINCLMNFYSLCVAEGAPPFAAPGEFVAPAAGLSAFARLRSLLQHIEPAAWSRNPIASHELVASAANTRLAYCPLAYGYSNYARPGFAGQVLKFGEPPTLHGLPLRTTLGGAGLAVSARTRHPDAALAYARFVAAPETQRTLYTRSGGQPGHRSAWLDADNNTLAGDYFRATLPVLDRAYVRPQFPGYIPFQEEASNLLHAALRGPTDGRAALEAIGDLYRQALLPVAVTP